MTKINLRTYHKTDRERVIQLVEDGLAEFGFEYSKETSEADLENIENEYFNNNGTFLILENHNQKLLAIGAIRKVGNHTYKIRKMYVAKNHRGRGYGKAVLNHLLDTAKDKGAIWVLLETSSLMISAMALYERFGFEKTNEKPSSPRCDFTFSKKITND